MTGNYFIGAPAAIQAAKSWRSSTISGTLPGGLANVPLPFMTDTNIFVSRPLLADTTEMAGHTTGSVPVKNEPKRPFQNGLL